MCHSAGATKCLQCGKGTSANEAKSECLFNCTYTTRSPKFEAPVTFDVSFMGSGVLVSECGALKGSWAFAAFHSTSFYSTAFVSDLFHC